MSTTLARLLLGGFLIAHGLVHGLYFAPPEENNPKWAFQLDRSWILEHLRVDPSVWRRIGLSLSVVVLFALFWHRWLWIGTLLNAAIIVALVWASWPPASALGE
jgi:hypothetical protein